MASASNSILSTFDVVAVDLPYDAYHLQNTTYNDNATNETDGH